MGHASDTLARKLIGNGEQNHKLNFPDDFGEMYPNRKKSSIFIGVSYNKQNKRWEASRRNKNEQVHNGSYKDEETAAHASDTLARELMAKGKENKKLNFPDDDTEVCKKNQKNKRKRSDN